MRYGQLVIGPAGSGKSTYCSVISKYCEDSKRQVSIVNLDPAAEQFDYEPYIDIRDLIHVDDVMEDADLRYGPNGGLVFCLEYLTENLEWLEDKLGPQESDDYVLFDCPGQIELYTHLDCMRKLLDHLHRMDFNICAVYLIDSKFMVEPSVFMSGVLTALSAMVTLEVPHVNVMSKIDLLSKHSRKQLERFLEPNLHLLLEEELNLSSLSKIWRKKYAKLTNAIASLIDEYSMVRFMPLNKEDDESISDLLFMIDNAIQYGEDQDVKVKYPEEKDDDGGGDEEED